MQMTVVIKILLVHMGGPEHIKRYPLSAQSPLYGSDSGNVDNSSSVYFVLDKWKLWVLS